MARPMYGWSWSDGTYRDGPEPKTQHSTQTQPKPRKPWIKRGFFTDGPDAPRQAALTRDSRAYHCRMWLERTFTKPTPARTVLELGRKEGFSEWALRRARIRLGVKTIRSGGKGAGRRCPWLWHFPSKV